MVHGVVELQRRGAESVAGVGRDDVNRALPRASRFWELLGPGCGTCVKKSYG